jgi:hypothetical protein
MLSDPNSDQHDGLRRVLVLIQPLAIHKTVKIAISNELIMANGPRLAYKVFLDTNGKSSLAVHKYALLGLHMFSSISSFT